MTRLPITLTAATLVAALAALAMRPAPAGAQLTLRDALRRAEPAAFANRAAAGNTAAQRGQALAPLRGILPSLHVEAGFVRTSDPIATFGSTLRQRAITAADFDPSRLNYPAPVNNYTGGLVLEQPILNADAWTGRRAATRAADATAAAEQWTRVDTRTGVVRAYYGAVLAAERVATLEAAARAAHAHVAEAEALVRNGLATKSDALLAAVRAGDVDAQLADATGGAETARRQLSLVLGRAGGLDVALPAALPSPASIRGGVAPDTAALAPRERADVVAATRGLDAARDDALRARSTYLPRVNGFARYDWNSAARLYAGDRNWTVGVMASWSPFSGASELADAEATAGRATAARAQADAAAARAALDVEQTRTALGVALVRLDIAEHAVAQSAEAHRLVERKYANGLATVVELLDAQAVETQSALGLSQSRYTAIVADAERRQALGEDPGTLAVLDDAAPAVAAHDTTAHVAR